MTGITGSIPGATGRPEGPTFGGRQLARASARRNAEVRRHQRPLADGRHTRMITDPLEDR